MQDIFDWIDKQDISFNIFRKHRYCQKVVLYFSLSMFIPWILLGFDSGVGMFEIWENNWQINYPVYGRSLHFSAFIIYGFLFWAISRHLEKLGLTGSKNVFYTASLSVFNIGLFEMWYMSMFAIFQMQRNLVEWFLTDFWEVPVIMNFMFVVLGSVALFCVYVDGFKVNNNKVVGRFYMFKMCYTKFCLIFSLLVIAIFFWIHYPFPITTISISGWNNSSFFPQTHYAYVGAELYVANDLLHLVNLIVKSLFAFMHLHILTRFQKVKTNE